MFGKIDQHQKKQPMKQKKAEKYEEKLAKNLDGHLEKLQGSSFRMLNELLYTKGSEAAFEHFQENPEDFNQYHEGYKHQMDKWPEKPVEVIIKMLQDRYVIQSQQMTVLDLGCGDGQLEEYFTQNPHQNVKRVVSYDLQAKKPFVKVADIAHLPRKEDSADVCVFSLSLMGTNYLDFLLEAHRVTRRNGYLIIAEVASRLNTLKRFIQMIEFIGYKVYQKNVTNPMFVMLVFKKTETQHPIKPEMMMLPQHQDSFRLKYRMTYLEFAQMVLTPIPYKKR